MLAGDRGSAHLAQAFEHKVGKEIRQLGLQAGAGNVPNVHSLP